MNIIYTILEQIVIANKVLNTLMIYVNHILIQCYGILIII